MTHAHIRDAAVDMDPVPSLVIDLAGKLVVVTERARAIFRVSAADVGRPLDDLAVSYQPTELRGLIEQAVADRRPALRRDVTWNTASGDARSYDVHVLPLIDNAGRLLGSKIVFVDISRYHRLQEELHTAKQELETAYEELQSSNEELETTNEELQSSNEELETTNEELQSANEELETMNEELQSTNVELETVNSQLRELSADTERTNGLLTSILGSLRCAVVVLNRELDVLVWNAYAEELWGLRAAEVEGRNFLKLDIGLPVAKLRAALGACLTGENDHQVTTLEAVNRRGQKMECHVTCSPLKNGGAPAKAGGVILLIDETREKT
jgi:two-component system CheB/CheR fusion protein